MSYGHAPDTGAKVAHYFENQISFMPHSTDYRIPLIIFNNFGVLYNFLIIRL